MNTSGKYIFRLGAVAFVLNWFWEMAQMFAYKSNPEDGWIQIHIFCTLASVVDALVTVGIYVLLTKIEMKKRIAFYSSAAALGALCAVVFERFAFAFGLWSYNETMPVVPALGVGILPLAQLALLVPLSIWLTGKLISRGRANKQRPARRQ
jgi:hypothetical protein